MKRFYQNLSLLNKIVLVLAALITGLMAIILTISLLLSTKDVLNQAKRSSKIETEVVSLKVQDQVNSELIAMNAIALSIESQAEAGAPINLTDLLEKFLKTNSEFDATWAYFTDSSVVRQDNRQALTFVAKSGYTAVGACSAIPPAVLSGKNAVSDVESYNNRNVLALNVPVSVKGRVVGTVGVFLDVAYFNAYLDTEMGFLKVISPTGRVVAHKNAASIGKVTDEGEKTNEILGKIQDGQSFGDFYKSETYKGDAFKYFDVFSFKNTDGNWTVSYVVSKSDFLHKSRVTNMMRIALVVFGIGIMLVFLYLFMRRFMAIIVEVSQNLKLLSVGEIDKVKVSQYDGNDEIGELSKSMNQLSQYLGLLTRFVREISKANFNVDIKAYSEQDIIGNAVIEMKNNLVSLSEMEKKRQQEENVRSWKIEGLSAVNDTLRKSNQCIDTLLSSTLRDMIGYVGAQQGGIFLVNSDDGQQWFELKSCIAFNRKRMMQKKVDIDEGLLGRCFYEKEPIILTEIPQDYLSITSGLGDRCPDALVILPLISNEQMLGAIELASFKVFTDDELEYLLKATEALASAVSNVLITERTQALLEQSKLYAEEMSAQEEEMRQNMEEMHASQEEMDRKTEQYEEEIAMLKEQLATLQHKMSTTPA